MPQGLYSSVACPGTMLTNLTYGILPPFVWTLLMPVVWLVSADRVLLSRCCSIRDQKDGFASREVI